MPRDDGTVLEPVGRVNTWVVTELPSLNQDILARRRPPGDLGTELARSVLADIPLPESLTVREAQQRGIPPSGALDPEAIARDCLLGVRSSRYQAHIERIFPALLDTERELLSRLAGLRKPSEAQSARTGALTATGQ